MEKQEDHFKKCAPLLLKRALEDLECMDAQRALLHAQSEQTAERNRQLTNEVEGLRKRLEKISALCGEGNGRKKRRRKEEGDFQDGCETQLTAPRSPDSPFYSPPSPS